MDVTAGKLLLFVAVLTRISAFLLAAPVFSWAGIPVRIRVAGALLLAIFFSTINPSPVPSGTVSLAGAIFIVASEATYGLALGIIAGILFGIVKLAGEIIEREMGFSMAEILDPVTGEPAQPLGALMEMVFIILFLQANGHHLLLSIIARSYEVFPVGDSPSVSVMTEGIMQAGCMMLTAALRLSAPLLAAFLLLLAVLAILSRIVPEMDIFFISFPVLIVAGLLMSAMLLPFIGGFIGELAQYMNRFLPL